MCLIREVKHTVSVKFHILYMQLLGLPMIHVWVNLGQWYQTISCGLQEYILIRENGHAKTAFIRTALGLPNSTENSCVYLST